MLFVYTSDISPKYVIKMVATLCQYRDYNHKSVIKFHLLVIILFIYPEGM